MKKYTQLNIRHNKYPSKSKAVTPKMKIKKGDKVRVISGKDKGKIGAVLRALPKDHKIIVENVAVHKRHSKKRGNQSGRIVERAMPIHVSNVAKVD